MTRNNLLNRGMSACDAMTGRIAAASTKKARLGPRPNPVNMTSSRSSGYLAVSPTEMELFDQIWINSLSERGL